MKIKIPDPQSVWYLDHRDIRIKIVSWRHKDPSGYFRQRSPSGNWNYYVYLPEHRCPNFGALWLEDEVKSVTPNSRGWITHDYYGSPLGDVDMHGGITFYAKHGYTFGFRVVEIGCDYSHLFDDGRSYTVEGVAAEALATVEDLIERGILTKEK